MTPRALRGVLIGILTLVGALALPAGAIDTMSAGAPQGNVTPRLEPASGVAVVAQSAPVDGRVALLLHNATTNPVRIDRLSAVATSSGGALATRARAVRTYPQIVGPDELSLASVTFAKRQLGPDATLEVKVRSSRVSTRHARRVLSVGDLVLSAPQTGVVAQTMRATVTNATAAWTARHPQVAVMCFSEAATPTTFTAAKASARQIAPGKSASASVALGSLCPTYLVAARAS